MTFNLDGLAFVFKAVFVISRIPASNWSEKVTLEDLNAFRVALFASLVLPLAVDAVNPLGKGSLAFRLMRSFQAHQTKVPLFCEYSLR